jgi:hypothetical protein
MNTRMQAPRGSEVGTSQYGLTTYCRDTQTWVPLHWNFAVEGGWQLWVHPAAEVGLGVNNLSGYHPPWSIHVSDLSNAPLRVNLPLLELTPL